jgi:glycosyltransferase involved in cell wall biosynthesis
MSTPLLSVVVPVYRGRTMLPLSLPALAASDLPRAQWELIVVDDASADGTTDTARTWADNVITLPGSPHGPAYARNKGAEIATGEWLVFLDADVVVHTDTLRRFVEAFDADPTMDACFGTYDDAPRARGLLTQYRNLIHRYVHITSAGPAETFWTGCGAVKRAAFVEVGGFDGVRYPQPKIEDIEFGYRLRDHGYCIVIVPQIEVTHLKRWRFLGSLRTDLIDRGIPWVTLLLERRRLARSATLNLKRGERAKALLVGSACLLLAVAVVMRQLLPAVLAGLILITVTLWNAPLFAWFARRRGVLFALAVIPLNLLYYLIGGLAVAAGLVIHLFRRRPEAGLTNGSPLPESVDSHSQ